jgi:hypothetical protein
VKRYRPSISTTYTVVKSAKFDPHLGHPDLSSPVLSNL